MWMLFDAALFAAGCIVSIYSWPRIRVWINRASSEAALLRQKALQIDAKLRGL